MHAASRQNIRYDKWVSSTYDLDAAIDEFLARARTLRCEQPPLLLSGHVHIENGDPHVTGGGNVVLDLSRMVRAACAVGDIDLSFCGSDGANPHSCLDILSGTSDDVWSGFGSISFEKLNINIVTRGKTRIGVGSSVYFRSCLVASWCAGFLTADSMDSQQQTTQCACISFIATSIECTPDALSTNHDEFVAGIAASGPRSVIDISNGTQISTSIPLPGMHQSLDALVHLTNGATIKIFGDSGYHSGGSIANTFNPGTSRWALVISGVGSRGETSLLSAAHLQHSATRREWHWTIISGSEGAVWLNNGATFTAQLSCIESQSAVVELLRISHRSTVTLSDSCLTAVTKAVEVGESVASDETNVSCLNVQDGAMMLCQSVTMELRPISSTSASTSFVVPSRITLLESLPLSPVILITGAGSQLTWRGGTMRVDQSTPRTMQSRAISWVGLRNGAALELSSATLLCGGVLGGIEACNDETTLSVSDTQLVDVWGNGITACGVLFCGVWRSNISYVGNQRPECAFDRQTYHTGLVASNARTCWLAQVRVLCFPFGVQISTPPTLSTHSVDIAGADLTQLVKASWQQAMTAMGKSDAQKNENVCALLPSMMICGVMVDDQSLNCECAFALRGDPAEASTEVVWMIDCSSAGTNMRHAITAENGACVSVVHSKPSNTPTHLESPPQYAADVCVSCSGEASRVLLWNCDFICKQTGCVVSSSSAEKRCSLTMLGGSIRGVSAPESQGLAVDSTSRVLLERVTVTTCDTGIFVRPAIDFQNVHTVTLIRCSLHNCGTGIAAIGDLRYHTPTTQVLVKGCVLSGTVPVGAMATQGTALISVLPHNNIDGGDDPCYLDIISSWLVQIRWLRNLNIARHQPAHSDDSLKPLTQACILYI